MKKTIWIMAIAALLTANSAWAADTRDNRADRYVLLAVQPIGIDAATLIAPPIQLGGYLGPNWLVTVEYGRRNFSLDTGSNNGKATGTFVNEGAAVRWFPGTNSFNLGLAFNQRSWDVDFTYTVSSGAGGPDIPVKANLKANAGVPALIIGNQWMMDFGLVIGLDWLILSTPATTTTSGTIDPAVVAGLTPAQYADAQKTLKDGGDTLNTVSGFPGLFVLTLGWAF